MAKFQKDNRICDQMLASARQRQLEHIEQCIKAANVHRRDKLAAESRLADMEEEIRRLTALNERIAGELQRSQRMCGRLKLDYDQLLAIIQHLTMDRSQQNLDLTIFATKEGDCVATLADVHQCETTRDERSAYAYAELSVILGSFDLASHASGKHLAHIWDENRRTDAAFKSGNESDKNSYILSDVFESSTVINQRNASHNTQSENAIAPTDLESAVNQKDVVQCAQSENDDYNRFECMDCKATFGAGDHLKLHWDNCDDRPLSMRVSSSTAVQSDFNPSEIIRNAEGLLICSHARCKKQFRHRSLLFRHMRIHSGERPFLCDEPECGQKFTQKTHLIKHKRTHSGDRPFQCKEPDCAKRFTDKWTLAKHMRIHSGDRPFQCKKPDCGKRFTDKATLIRHMIIHSGDRPFQCEEPDCGQKFTQKPHLINHMRIHSGERPFLCEEPDCAKRFTHKSTLTKHMRIHSGDRPFQCKKSVCGKKFKHKSHLIRHMRIHSGDRPFQCKEPDCGQKFTQKSHLIRHMRIHSG